MVEAAGLDPSTFFPQNEEGPNKILRAFPKPYIIGATTNAENFLSEIKDAVILTGIKMTTFWGDSLPNGTKNLALPETALRGAK
jgi:hypothetical protein